MPRVSLSEEKLYELAKKMSQSITDGVYRERNQLIAALSKLFPSWVGIHEGSAPGSWDKEWLNVVYIELPTGQVSWHIHNSEVGLFSHLKECPPRKWDGHTMQEKYDRLGKLGGKQ